MVLSTLSQERYTTLGTPFTLTGASRAVVLSLPALWTDTSPMSSEAQATLLPAASSFTFPDRVCTAAPAATQMTALDATVAAPPAHAASRALSTPGMSVVPHINGPSIDDKHGPTPQCQGHLVAGRFQYAAVSRAGDAHYRRGFLVVDRFEVRETEGFDLIQAELDFLSRTSRRTYGLETHGRWKTLHPPPPFRTPPTT